MGFKLNEFDANEGPILFHGSNLEELSSLSCICLLFLTEFLQWKQRPIIHNFLSIYREL